MCVSEPRIAERGHRDGRIRDEVVVACVQSRGSIIPWLEPESAVVAQCCWSDLLTVVICSGGAVEVGVCESRVPSNGESTCVLGYVCAGVLA